MPHCCLAPNQLPNKHKQAQCQQAKLYSPQHQVQSSISKVFAHRSTSAITATTTQTAQPIAITVAGPISCNATLMLSIILFPLLCCCSVSIIAQHLRSVKCCAVCCFYATVTCSRTSLYLFSCRVTV
jgi:hypothetical protein